MKKVDYEGGGAWADLPSELLETIHCKLDYSMEIIKLRSVCRWWRLSTLPPPRSKISRLFPLTPSLPDKSDFVINAIAVYLVRNKGTVWMVSVQEESPGNLILRHPLSHRKIEAPAEMADWITATHTPIARFYAHHLPCVHCKGLETAENVAFTTVNSGSGQQLVGLTMDSSNYLLRAFRIELARGTIATQFQNFPSDIRFEDYVTFKGRIFIVDRNGRIYALDHTSLQLIQLSSIPGDYYLIRFVESDGDLYMVASHEENGLGLYKIQVVDGDGRCQVITEKVEQLGDDDDKVVFIGLTGCFVVSARDLPPPWKGKGKCFVVDYGGILSPMCAQSGCEYYSVIARIVSSPRVFFLGEQPHGTSLHSSYGRYAELFSPPAAADAAAAD